MIPDGVTIIRKTGQDRELMRELTSNGIPPKSDQPENYSGYVVVKPWGYEFQVFNSVSFCVWLACLRAKQAVSMHCHQKKQAMFVPMTEGIVLRTLDDVMPLSKNVAVDAGVFHSQENNTGDDMFFLEYEWPSDKSDLVRYKDRYGRESKGYEGRKSMLTFAEAIEQLKFPDEIRMFMGEVA